MRDRDAQGRARNARPRDGLGRPLPYGATGVPELPEDLDPSPAAVVDLAQTLLDDGLPFQAHEALEVAWKAAPEPQRPAWQGLAQLAVAVTHARRGNLAGARVLAARGRDNLAAGELPAVAWGLRDRLLALTTGAAQ
jgi:hypothetical protein